MKDLTPPAPHIVAAVIAILLLACACSEPLDRPRVPAPLEVGETVEVELRYIEFNVTNFTETFTKQDLLELPTEVQETLWLLDLDLSNGESSPRLLDNALAQIQALDPSTLDPAARNMQALLNTTPDNADLSGTSFERVIDLSPVIGVSPAAVLADMLQINVEDTFLTPDSIAEAILTNVIGAHPNVSQRRGPVTADNPEGLYPVTPGSLPVTLADAASDFRTLSTRFGPTIVDGVYHPGFIVGDVSSAVFDDNFAMTVRANVNALPFKGIDLGDATRASVNSIASQVDHLFDFDDPDWLTVEGLVPGVPVIEQMTFQILEHDGFVDGGRSPHPDSTGNSPAWQLPTWSLERMLIGGARDLFDDLDSEIEYFLHGEEDPAFTLFVEDGWAEIYTTGGLGSPPAPQYVWDVLLEVAQVRLHDGGLAEGEGNVAFTLSDVAVGVDTATIEETIRENLEADPSALVDVASLIVDNTVGDADFYYVRDPEAQQDYLQFVTAQDIARDDEGLPTRDYNYESPGFFSDIDLTNKVSEVLPSSGHERVAVSSGDILFCADDEGRTFELRFREKPSDSRIAIGVTRVR